MNRLVKEREYHPEGIFKKKYIYDVLGNLVATRDMYRMTTHFEYDALHRKVATVECDGRRETVTYNALNHIVSSTDGNGQVTRFERNWRGEPTRIYYPDGSTEGFTYDSKGRLLEHHQTSGLILVKTYDWQGRFLTEKTLDKERKQLIGGNQRIGNVESRKGFVVRKYLTVAITCFSYEENRFPTTYQRFSKT